MRRISGCAKSMADAARKGLAAGMQVRWSAEGRAAFALRDPEARGTYLHPSNVSGAGNVRWDGRRSVDAVDLHFIERAP